MEKSAPAGREPQSVTGGADGIKQCPHCGAIYDIINFETPIKTVKESCCHYHDYWQCPKCQNRNY